jgi:hypothetical protein
MNKNIVVILIIGLTLFGCNGPEDTTVEQPSAPSEVDETKENLTDEVSEPIETDDEENDSIETTPDEGNKVLILGRSVAYDWMNYLDLEWTCDDEECATGSPRGNYDDYYFIYYELDYPPDIARSAADGADLYGSDADVVFFKFCFVDFASDESLQNAKDNEKLVEDVYQYIVVDRGKKLIVGNALPQVSAHTDSALVSNQKHFNNWLDNFASTNDDIQVLDLYGTLADSNGNLNSEYAVASDDSHLTDSAYDEITPEFLDLIEKS